MMMNSISTLLINETETAICKLPIDNNAFSKMIDVWDYQYVAFINNAEIQIGFDPGYSPKGRECFVEEYKMPKLLVRLRKYPALKSFDISKDSSFLKAFVVFMETNSGSEVLLFQLFQQSQIIRTGKILWFDSGEFKSPDDRSLSFRNSLDAVYEFDNEKLWFKSFHNVNKFLDLEGFFKEATDDDIRDLFNHKRLNSDNIEEVLENLDNSLKKKLSILKHNPKVIDNLPASEIQNRAKPHNIEIDIKNEQIVFPLEKMEIREMLKFLNEEYYIGPLSGDQFESNSTRRRKGS